MNAKDRRFLRDVPCLNDFLFKNKVETADLVFLSFVLIVLENKKQL